MSFGVSGEDKESRMIGGDVVVAWLDSDSFQGRVEDYFLEDKAQCSGTRGSCPDIKLQGGTESIRLLSAARSDGHTVITYQRPLNPVDLVYDRSILTNGTKQAFIWAIGPLNSRNEVSYHRIANRHNVILDFGRYPEWNCPRAENTYVEESEEEVEEVVSPPRAPVIEEERPSDVQTPAPAPKVNAWKIPPIPCYEPDDGVYYAQMGPTGGKRGYPAITGRTYTFVVEGGADPETPARYHPLYITDDHVGGYAYKTEAERAGVQVFAGVEWDQETGEPRPTAVGRLCNWTPDPDKPADEATSFGAYQRTLSLVCDDQNEGRPGILRWTPDVNTPDTVYYQCYTHRYLGWKINVVDSCDGDDSHSRQQQQRRPSGRRGRGRSRKSEDASRYDDSDSLVPRESIQVSTRVRPDGAGVGEKPVSSASIKPQIRYVEIQRNGSVEAAEEGVPSVELTAPHAGVTEKVLLPERKSVRPTPRRLPPPHQRTKGFRPANLERRVVPHRGFPPRATFSNRGEIDARKRGTTLRESGFHPRAEGVDLAPRRIPAILLKGKKKKMDNRQTESLEPIFVPSPPDLLSTNITSSSDAGEEETKMEANERVNSYSLPPKPQPAKVVSYDGKTIDPSLTSVGLPEREGSPRSARPIQSTPQFGPFLGEAPPPVPADVVPASLPQLKSGKSEGLVEPPRLDSDTVDSKRKVVPGIGRESRRGKREAHHEPGHEEEHDENRLKMNSKKCEGKDCEGNSSSAALVANVAFLVVQMVMRQLL
ncbi:hypothetical protein J437_LFUL007733 [Ladona fulva]|uniref:DOMON domain-containing protein n=1 Tax=Ladona fulva TaxID=123851 RepID=A0A8K0P6R5_LADFU|nr:hypothetical protein J437_LFUL007733 [Ladona fulva]